MRNSTWLLLNTSAFWICVFNDSNLFIEDFGVVLFNGFIESLEQFDLIDRLTS